MIPLAVHSIELTTICSLDFVPWLTVPDEDSLEMVGLQSAFVARHGLDVYELKYGAICVYITTQ